MSGYAFLISFSFVLIGQVAADDRYGSSPAATPSDVPSSPFSETPRRQVSPPPAFAPPKETQPEVTARDYERRSATSRAAAPPPSSRSTLPVESTRQQPQEGVKPPEMIQNILTAPANSRLSGRPTALADVLLGASSRQEQSRRLEAYWDLSSSVADYYLGVREQDELQRLRADAGSVGPVWQQAETEAGLRISASERAAKASQLRLASLIGQGSGGILPLPADLPHCGDYYARYDQVFAGRSSPEAQELSELLPMRYAELTDAAQTIERAEEFLAAVAAQRGGDGTGTLRALELLALRRRAFVQIARDYNRRIARYTELAAPGQIDTARLIGMLIMRDGNTSTATRPRTNVPPPNRQSQLNPDDFEQTDDVQTFAEGWESIKSAAATVPRDESVKPASAEAKRSKPRREHSLLVPAE